MKNIKILEKSLQILVSILLLVFICACSASGPRYLEIAPSISQVLNNLSRVYFLRPATVIYSAADIRIKANGMLLGRLPNNGFFYQDMNPGNTSFNVDYWGSTGDYTRTQMLEGGKTYYSILGPRDSNVVGAAIFGSLGQIGEYAIADGKQDGSFEMLFVTEQQAMSEIHNLKYSRN